MNGDSKVIIEEERCVTVIAWEDKIYELLLQLFYLTRFGFEVLFDSLCLRERERDNSKLV